MTATTHDPWYIGIASFLIALAIFAIVAPIVAVLTFGTEGLLLKLLGF